MWCPRLDHFVRFNPNGTVSRCGHMVAPAQFDSLDKLESSQWLKQIKHSFDQDIWPSECVRCREMEHIGNTSIRQSAIEVYETRSQDNYLQVAGVLDNVCNSACQFCNPSLSTKIGSLTTKDYVIVNNSTKFFGLPLDRIEHLDINGGEPSASKNYKQLLENLPKNLKTLRMNTNCAVLLPQLKLIQQRGVEVTVTVSFDGIGSVHDYVRWPIKWEKFVENLNAYRQFGLHKINLWTTINALNINDIENILNFVKLHQLEHSFAFLKYPTELNVEFENKLTEKAKLKYSNSTDPVLQKISNMLAIKENNQDRLEQFVTKQDKLRSISITDFIDFV